MMLIQNENQYLRILKENYLPADLWNRDNLFTTCGVACVRTSTLPPYGEIGKTCVVPRKVETAAQRESDEKHISCTLALVSPL